MKDTLEYRKKMRLLKVRMLDGAIKAIMVDDSQIVSNMMVIICTKIGITNHDEYSLVREKTEDEENQTPNKKYGTLFRSFFDAERVQHRPSGQNHWRDGE